MRAELNPTEALIVVLLVSRYRLGEKVTVLDASFASQVSSLIKKGLVVHLDESLRDNLRVMLTGEAIAHYLSDDYVPPIARNNRRLVAVFKSMAEEGRQFKRRLEHSRYAPSSQRLISS